jgi:hypothetical protein
MDAPIKSGHDKKKERKTEQGLSSKAGKAKEETGTKNSA